jgi:hypothetical protein
MNDPHVVALHYAVTFPGGFGPTSPPPLEHQTPDFDMRLADRQLVLTFKQHYPSEAAARLRADECLRSWEIDFALSSGPRRMRFEFVKSEIVDRQPPIVSRYTPSESGPGKIAYTSAVMSATVHAYVGAIAIPNLYPAIPTDFVASPDVETLWHRYDLYTQGRESFLSMAYFCLSLLQRLAGGRAKAAILYAVDGNVLDTLGTLTSSYGDEATARKLDDESTLKKLTGTQPQWIDEVVRRLIRRAGEAEWAAANGTQLAPLLTMATFVKLAPPVPPRRAR